MSTDRKSFKKWWADLKKPFRLVLINPETFEEKKAYVLTNMGVLLAVLSALFIIIGLTTSLIFFTGIRTLVPGYADIEQHPELMRLNEDFRLIEEELIAQRAYTENFRKILVGEIEMPEISEEINEEFPDSLLTVERIAEDELLRKEIELDKQIAQSGILSKSGQPGTYDISLDQTYLIPPISGSVSASFDPKIDHFGADITAPKNTPIKAVKDGFVFLADWTLETGHTIGIQHANNVISFYKHNSSLLKKTGDMVKSGEAIAIIGNTGTHSSGPHLHFELWYKGLPVNPEEYLSFN